MATKLALALAVGIAFPLLEFAGFVADSAADNSETALLLLAVLYGGAPVVIKLLALPLVWWFPLDEQQQRDLREQLS